MPAASRHHDEDRWRPLPHHPSTSRRSPGIAGIVAAVQSGERERSKMRVALERIQGILADALG